MSRGVIVVGGLLALGVVVGLALVFRVGSTDVVRPVSGGVVAERAPDGAEPAQLAPDGRAEVAEGVASPPVERAWGVELALRGVLADSKGQPIPGAIVRLREELPSSGSAPWSGTVTSNGTGAFTATQLPAAPLRIDIAAPGCAPKELRNLLAHLGDGELGQIAMEPGLSIEASVTDELGVPVRGAKVAAYRWSANRSSTDPIAEAVTSPAGRFRLSPLPLGPCILRIDADGFLRCTFDVLVERDNVLSEPFVLPHSPTILGVVDGLRNTAKASAVAELLSGEPDHPAGTRLVAEVEPSGEFRFGTLPALGRWRVWCGELNSTADDRLVPISDAVVVERAPAHVTLTAAARAHVTFRAVDPTGAAIPSAEAQLFWDKGLLAGPVPVDDKGRGSVPFAASPELRTLRLTVAAPGFGEVVAKLDVSQPGARDLGDLTLARSVQILVQTVDAATNAPVGGVRIRTAAWPTSEAAQVAEPLFRPIEALTDRDGTAKFELPPGAAVEFAAIPATSQYGIALHRLAAGSPTPSQVLIPLEQGRELHVVVTSEGTPAKGVAVSLEGEYPGSAMWGSEPAMLHRVTDPNGLATFVGLSASLYSVLVPFPSDAQTQWHVQQCTIEREDMTVHIELGPKCSLTGVLRRDGRPVAGARVSSAVTTQMVGRVGFRPIRKFGQATTDRNGVFHLSDATPGAVAFVIEHPLVSPVSRFAAVLAPGENHIELDGDPGSLRGRVLDGAGEPVAGADLAIRTVAPSHELALPPTRQPTFRASSEADGTFAIEDLPVGVEFEWLAGAQFVSDPPPVAKLRPGEQRKLDPIEVQATGSLQITFEFVGDPFQVIAVLESDGEMHTPSPTGPGTIVANGLKPGLWHVQLRAFSLSGPRIVAEASTEVRAGAQSPVHFQLSR